MEDITNAQKVLLAFIVKINSWEKQCNLIDEDEALNED